MSHRFIMPAALVFLGLGAFLLPALSQAGDSGKTADKERDAKLRATRDELKRVEALNAQLTRELGDRFDQLTTIHERHEAQAKKSGQRILALETALNAAGAPIPRDEKQEAALVASRNIADLLSDIIDTKGLQEPVKLKVALEYFSDKFGGRLPILVDKAAFADLGENRDVNPYEEEVVLPPVPARMTMATALRLALSQVGRGQATYVIRKGFIEIVPEKYTTAPYFLYKPMIAGTYMKRPFAEIMADIADQTGIGIDIDPAVGKKSMTPITVKLRNCSLEDALTPATEMAGLKYVVLNRSIYVTTAARARVLEKEEAIRRQKRETAPKPAPNAKRLDKAAE